MAKDIMPTTAWNLLVFLFNKHVIHDKKEDILDRDSQSLEELTQGNLRDLLHCPNALPQELSEAGKRLAQERMGKGLHHGGSMDFFDKLGETDNKGREDFKRRS